MSVGGACCNNNEVQLGLQQIAAGGSAMLKLLRCGSSSEDGASDNSVLWSWQRKPTCASGATRCCRQAGGIRLFDGNLRDRATLFIVPTVVQYTYSWRGPRMRCLRNGDERGVRGRARRAPRTLCFSWWRCEAASKRSGFDNFTFCQTAGVVAVTPQQRVPYGGGLLGAGLSISLVFSIDTRLCLGSDYMCRRRWLVLTGWTCPPGIAL